MIFNQSKLFPNQDFRGSYGLTSIYNITDNKCNTTEEFSAHWAKAIQIILNAIQAAVDTLF